MSELNSEKFLIDLQFDEEQINNNMNKVDKVLKDYIDDNILQEYELNDGGHNLNHIRYVLKRAFELP